MVMGEEEHGIMGRWLREVRLIVLSVELSVAHLSFLPGSTEYNDT